MSQASNQPKIAYNYLGRTGLKVSEICLGAMTFGPTRFPMPTCDESTAFKIMDRFAELGGNFIDTADVYGPHNSENIVGNWLQKTGQRDNFVVATKCTNLV
jgi:aryl-alcohol dehydrogenase-like predicted oxidoreductase